MDPLFHTTLPYDYFLTIYDNYRTLSAYLKQITSPWVLTGALTALNKRLFGFVVFKVIRFQEGIYSTLLIS